MNVLTFAPQLLAQVASPLLLYRPARCGPVAASAIATAARAAPATMACGRNCRQVVQIIGTASELADR